MPYPFALPTTGATALDSSFTSTSHPGLINAATSHRALVRTVLKRHKRLPVSARASNLPVVQEALNSYAPYLQTILTALSSVGSGQLQITETKQFTTEWRSTLSTAMPGREPARIKVAGIQHELALVLSTLAYTYHHLARSALWQLSRAVSPTIEERAASIATAMKHLLEAASIHAFVAASLLTSPSSPIDAAASPGLAALARAEATLVVAQKDDPYAAAVAESRNEDSKAWMISAPSMPKVRAHLFARLSLAAADHAAKATSLLAPLQSQKLDDGLVRYADDLRRTARAKAARFLAVDAEGAGRTGEAIAWLRGAKCELGVLGESDDDGGKRKGFRGIKQSWSERREDRRIETGAENWGLDAGRLEETRVVEWLEAKWVKANDVINVQVVPPFEPLLASMPSGREYHTFKTYAPSTLPPEVLSSLRMPGAAPGGVYDLEGDSSDEGGGVADTPGAFPGSSAASASYY